MDLLADSREVIRNDVSVYVLSVYEETQLVCADPKNAAYLPAKSVFMLSAVFLLLRVIKTSALGNSVELTCCKWKTSVAFHNLYFLPTLEQHVLTPHRFRFGLFLSV